MSHDQKKHLTYCNKNTILAVDKETNMTAWSDMIFDEMPASLKSRKNVLQFDPKNALRHLKYNTSTAKMMPLMCMNAMDLAGGDVHRSNQLPFNSVDGKMT